MTAQDYLEFKERLQHAGYQHDIEWAQNVKAPKNAVDFFLEYVFVVVNSGMKATIAVKIYENICDALQNSQDIAEVFGHKGKVSAIKHVLANVHELYTQFLLADDKVVFCESLPWIGPITKYHLAKNFGVDCCKPDRHLVRIAKELHTTPDELCGRLSEETGDRIGLVDYVIWRSSSLGWI